MKKSLKILAIGNSYSNNATQYISKIAESLGIDMYAASLYKDGCMIHQHIDFYETYEALGHDAYYDDSNPKKHIHLYINGVADTSIRSLQESVALQDWDFITLQQMPNSCDRIDRFWTAEKPDLVTLYDYVKTELAKNGNTKCEILLHQGWSFSHEMSINNNYKWYPVNYENTKIFFEKIEKTVAEAASIVGREKGLDAPLDIILAGKAMQLAKDQFGFGDTFGDNDSLYADFISHLSNIARYMIGCVWVETFAKKAGLTETDVRKATFVPDIEEINPDIATALRSCAHETVTGKADTIYGDWRAIPEGDGLKITCYMGEAPKDGKVIIPAFLGDKKVLSVGEKAFKYAQGVTEIIRAE